MKTITKSLFLALVAAVVPVALAQHQTFTANPDASQVGFALAGTGHHVNGTFHVQSASVDFDRTAMNISGSVIVAAGSGNSDEPSRDKKIRLPASLPFMALRTT